MYEDNSPLAERRAAALALDQSLLAELLGRTELRDLLDPEVMERAEAELQWLADEGRAKDIEGIADMLRLLGPLTTDQVIARSRPEVAVPVALEELEATRRAVRVRIAGTGRWIGVEDVGRL